MPIRNSIADSVPEVTQWRRLLHQHPQTGYEEEFASAMVMEKLDEWGIPYESGIAKTGIVGWIDGNRGETSRTIGLRADMDALDIEEESGQDWSSLYTGKMHACGHDGHTSMLLGAARYLAGTRDFSGRVYLIFQPAEEGHGGAMRMLDEGLFDRFPMDEVYAIHTEPALEVGTFGTCKGPILAASDKLYITLFGRGGHAAMPHKAKDPVLAAGHVIVNVQNYIARELDPLQQAVISLTNIEGGTGANNVIPEKVHITGSVRLFDTALRENIMQRLDDIIYGTCASLGLDADISYIRGYDPTTNAQAQTARAVETARSVSVPEKVFGDYPPTMGAEDFGAMLQHRPGCYIFLGQADPKNPDSPHNFPYHSSHFDFNDDALGYGMEYWVRLVEQMSQD